MDTTMIKTTNFNINTLLGLSDDVKIDIIHLLSKSLLQKKIGNVTPKSTSLGFSKEAIDTIDSLMLQGGKEVPDDINDIQSLIDYKYNKE